MHEVLVNRLGGLSLPRKCVVTLTDHPDMTFDVYRGRKTTTQQHPQHSRVGNSKANRTTRPNFGSVQEFYISKFEQVLI